MFAVGNHCVANKMPVLPIVRYCIAASASVARRKLGSQSNTVQPMLDAVAGRNDHITVAGELGTTGLG
jgi:hypothetical protein